MVAGWSADSPEVGGPEFPFPSYSSSANGSLHVAAATASAGFLVAPGNNVSRVVARLTLTVVATRNGGPRGWVLNGEGPGWRRCRSAGV